MPQSILAISLFFHILATALWIGGILLITALVFPEINRALADQPALHQLLLRIRARFAQVSNLSLAALIVTGLLQMTADPHYDGLLQLDNEWSRVLLIKHVLILLMALAGLVLQFGVAPALERSSLLLQRGQDDQSEWQRLRRNERRLSLVIAALALLILAASAWLTSL